MVIKNGGNLLLGTTSDGGQRLQVAGTVAKTAAGPTTIVIASNEAYNLRDEGRLFIVGNASAGSRYLGLEYYDVGNGAYRNVAAVPNGGNLLIGTTADGGNGKLQLAESTSSAGGIGFGTETSLYRTAAGQLVLNVATGNNYSSLYLSNNGTTKAFLSYGNSATSLYIGTNVANGLIEFSTAAAVTALTLDSSQNATFAGTVSISTTGYNKVNSLNFYRSNSGYNVLFTGTNDLSINNQTDTVNLLVLTNAGALKLSTYGAGTLVTDASGNVTASSDSRLKTNIRTFVRGLADILKLTPKTYNWSEQSGFDRINDYTGFVAQDVQAAIPEAVYEGKDSAKTLTLNDRAILAAVVNAIKELNAKIA